MTDRDATADDHLLEELKEALTAADPVPDDVLAAAKASFTWRTIDAELAEIEFDSALEATVGVRGGPGERQVMFRSEHLEIEVIVHGTDERRLAGQLIPPQPATVELLGQEGRWQTETDDSGAFEFDEVPAGPVSLKCTLADGTTVTTEWTIL